MAEGGALVHVLDGYGLPERPWDVDPAQWLSPFGDTFDASLLNVRHPDAFVADEGPLGGKPQPFLVYEPQMATSRVSCFYSQDGGSMAASCNERGGDGGCLPGCIPSWCGEDGAWANKCNFRPHALFAMMQEQDEWWQPWGHVFGARGGKWAHNEVVLDAWNQPWVDALPGIIEAIVIRPECDAEARALGERVHADFLRYYGLQPDDEHAPPLLLYDVLRNHTPFSLYNRRSVPYRAWPI